MVEYNDWLLLTFVIKLHEAIHTSSIIRIIPTHINLLFTALIYLYPLFIYLLLFINVKTYLRA